MSYVALYRKWRPLVFEDVIGQDHLVATLRNAAASGRVAHAYLFSGTRGTGKTTVARIFARAINCLAPAGGDPCNACEICKDILAGTSMDVIEIDAASNNGVEDVRQIRDEVVYAPSRAKYKVYIVDEVHMLSGPAFNALLKTLEEPPPHAVFLLATTEPHKLPATILSRCQKFDFKRIGVDRMVERLGKIAEASGAKLEPEAAQLIARTADGALRDAISVLDQCIQAGGAGKDAKITADDVAAITGMFGGEFLAKLTDAMIDGDTAAVLTMVDQMIFSGKEVPRLVNDMTSYFRDMLLTSVSPGNDWLSASSLAAADRMKKQASKLKKSGMIRMIELLSELEAAIKWTGNPRVTTEVALIRMCNVQASASEDLAGLAERVAALEKMLGDGPPPAPAAPAAPPAPPAPKNDEAKGPSQAMDPSPAKLEPAKDDGPTPAEPASEAAPEASPPAADPAPETKPPQASVSEPAPAFLTDPEPSPAQASPAETPAEADAEGGAADDGSSPGERWKRVMDGLCGSDASMSSFLKDTEVYVDGKEALTVVFPDERHVFFGMCSKGDINACVKDAVAKCFGEAWTVRMTLRKDFKKPAGARSLGHEGLPDDVRELAERLSIPIGIVE